MNAHALLTASFLSESYLLLDNIENRGKEFEAKEVKKSEVFLRESVWN